MKTKGGYSATSVNSMLTWNDYKRSDTQGGEPEINSGECPMCQAPLPEERGKDFPFCSKRCQLADLGNWFDERYKIGQ